MTYNRKIMRLELSAENPLNGGYYYAELLLPAADYEIKDAMQRTRAVGRENTVEVSILECDILPELQDIRLDTFSLDELNFFFAKRLASLPDEELPVFYAVTEQIFNDADENPVSIKDLINCTYGLDTVPVAHNVSNLSELGRFAFENGLLSDIDDIPESAIPFLNAEQIGRVQQKNDNGVFEGRLYIPTVHYDRPEVYDGVTLPEEEPENTAFLLKVGAYPKSAFFDEDPALHDLCLPADSDELFNVTAKCGEPEINLCFCYEFYSSIPQITSDMFDSMEEIDELKHPCAAHCGNERIRADKIQGSAERRGYRNAKKAHWTLPKICGGMNLPPSPIPPTPFLKIMLPRMRIRALTTGGSAVCLREMRVNAYSVASVRRLPITALFPPETVICSSPFRMTSRRQRN